MIKVLNYSARCKTSRGPASRAEVVPRPVDNPAGIPYACSMKAVTRTTIAIGIIAFGAVSVTAQVGPTPAGFRAHESVEVPIAFYYPSTWTVVDRDESVGVVSRPALAEQLGSDAPSIQTGDALLALGVMPTAFIEMMGSDPDDLDSIVDMLFENISAESGEIAGAERRELEFSAGTVASMLFNTTGRRGSGMMLVAHESSEVLAFGMAYGRRDDLQAYRRELAHVIATMEFTGTMEDFYDG